VSVARRVVLDASALLAWVLNERGADTIGTLSLVAVIPAPNFVEVLYRAPTAVTPPTPASPSVTVCALP